MSLCNGKPTGPWPKTATIAYAVAWIALLIYALWGKPAHGDELSGEEIKAEIAWQMLHAYDMSQTYHSVVRAPHCFQEKNPILGKHPSDGKLLAFAVAASGLHFGVTKILANNDAPVWLRRTWQLVSITEKGFAVVSNQLQGIGALHDQECSR